MHGLDFADMVSGQLVEVERAKVRVLATALVTALRSVDLTPEQSRAVTAAFFEQVRQVTTEAPPPLALQARQEDDDDGGVPYDAGPPPAAVALTPADQDLL